MGWVLVTLTDRSTVDARVVPDLRTAMNALGSAGCIGIDIPLGLVDAGDRDADAATRGYLKGQASSVFNAPPRPLLEATTYEQAQRISSEVQGKGLSRQSFGLFAKIRQADAFVNDPRVHEVHPEAGFRILHGGERLPSKKTWAGACLRRRLLQEEGIEVADSFAGAEQACTDDVLDAAVAAWSARRIARGESIQFPARTTQRDRGGRAIAIHA